MNMEELVSQILESALELYDEDSDAVLQYYGGTPTYFGYKKTAELRNYLILQVTKENINKPYDHDPDRRKYWHDGEFYWLGMFVCDIVESCSFAEKAERFVSKENTKDDNKAPLMLAHKACFWVEDQIKQKNSYSVFSIIDEAADKFKISGKQLTEVFQKMYPNLWPFSEPRDDDYVSNLTKDLSKGKLPNHIEKTRLTFLG